jgi:murein DD-endopeptidase MepM/ murein hydrolase activator NlpD
MIRPAAAPILFTPVACALAAGAALLAAGLALANRPAPGARPPLSAARQATPHQAARLVPIAAPAAADDDAPLPVLDAPPVLEASPVAAGPASAATAGDRLVEGPMEQVLYGPAPDAAGPTAQALGLFGHVLDLARDLALGDRVRLLLRRPSGGGPEVLDYAEVDIARGPVRLWRTGGEDAKAGEEAADAFVDDRGAGLRRLLLRTPLAHPRLTSGFGLRFHPLLGYTRMHQGVDFGAPVGTPVLAAGDGVVESAGWTGGYGRMIRLRHAGGYATGYAHLSAWSPGLGPGAAVRQGQVIGWTGNSGLSTGPHLHFEVRFDGRPIDPATAAPDAPPPSPERLAAFTERRQALRQRLAALEGAALASR